MDLARAIHKIDPGATYLLNHSQADGRQSILDWRGAGQEPTQVTIDAAWMDCLQDDASELLVEQERQKAILRLKGDAAFSDVVKVLRL